MPDWISVPLGIIIGVAVIGGAFFWAFKPRAPRRRSMLAPPSGLRDPMTIVDAIDTGSLHNSG